MPVTLSNSYIPVGSGGVSSTTTGVVVASGETIAVVVFLPNGTAVTSVDWGTDLDDFTQAASYANATYGDIEIWENLTPTAATRDITVNYDTTGTVLFGTYVFAGAGAISDPDTGTTAAATTHTRNVANVTADDFMIDAVISSGNIVFQTNQTELFDSSFGGNSAQSSSKDGALTVAGVMEWTSGAARDTTMLAVRVPEASAASGGASRLIGTGLVR